MDDDTKARLLAMPGYVVLGKRKGGNAYSGLTENSFSMGLEVDYVLFFWWITNSWGYRTADEARKDAEDHRDKYNKSHPDMDFEVWDVRDPNLPITLDWEGWVVANESADTLSGVRNKYRARNFKFEMRDVPAVEEVTS